MKIYIIIPGHNEERTIGALVSQCKQKGFDVIFIDDGSEDGSNKIAQEQGAIVITNKIKHGKGKSLRKGFKLALQNGCDGVITLDGDGQHSVDDIDGFIKKVNEEDADIVIGNRMNGHKGMPFVRFLTNKFMSSIISIACRQRIPDTQCGFRFLSSKILNSILLTSNEFEIETEILMKASKKGFKVYSSEIKTIYRDEESKINPLRDTLRFISYFCRELFSNGN